MREGRREGAYEGMGRQGEGRDGREREREKG